jgi:hypothetical protein
VSIVNIVARRHRAFIATDTLSVDGPGNPVRRIMGGVVRTPKFVAVPHARCVIAWRGSSPFIDGVREASLHIGCLDTALRELPEMLNSLMSQHCPHPEVADPWAMRQEVDLVGWSESLGCMVMALYWFTGSTKLERRLVFVDRDTQVSTCLSAHSAFKTAQMPETAEQMADLTRQSVALDWQTDPHLAVGGQLIVAEVTRDAINLTNHGDLGLPAPRMKG